MQVTLKMKGVRQQKNTREYSAGQIETHVIAGSESRVFHGGKVEHPRTSTNLYPRPSLIPLHLCSVEAFPDELSVQYIGQDSTHQETTDHIQIWANATDEHGNSDKMEEAISKIDVFLDPATHLPNRSSFITFATNSPSSQFHFELVYAGYQTRQGWTLPFNITKRMSGQDISKTIWSAIIAEQDIPDTEFDLGANR